MYPRPMSFWEATKLFWTRAFDFKGRSRRKEYWVPFFTQLVLIIAAFISFFVLLVLLGVAATSSTTGNLEETNTALGILGVFGIISGLFLMLICIVLIIPNLSLMVRRFHDIGKTGKWAILFYGVPVILSWINMIINGLNNDPENISMVALSIEMVLGLINLGIAIWGIVWLAQDSVPGPNQWGENPKGITHVGYQPYPEQAQSTQFNQNPQAPQYEQKQQDPYRY
ncbi:DUF805 domain-containing protein [Macrococcus capreoli]|uniref:DUF805 domain-containing protein n=1 Tax=Macrococcus capreoli TaxID=2982690 RepID=UPI003EE7CB45